MGIAAALVAASVLLFGGILSSSEATNPLAAAIASAKSGTAQQDALTRLLAGFATGNTAAYVRKLERRVAAQPQDADALTLLGLSYQQRARETVDPRLQTLAASPP